MSGFAQEFLDRKSPEITPQFVDFKKVIKTATLHKNLKIRAVQERESGIFRLHYIFEMGRTSERLLGLLAGYVPFLGTSKYTATQMQQAFYRSG